MWLWQTRRLGNQTRSYYTPLAYRIRAKTEHQTTPPKINPNFSLRCLFVFISNMCINTYINIQEISYHRLRLSQVSRNERTNVWRDSNAQTWCLRLFVEIKSFDTRDFSRLVFLFLFNLFLIGMQSMSKSWCRC